MSPNKFIDMNAPDVKWYGIEDGAEWPYPKRDDSHIMKIDRAYASELN